MMAYSCHPVIGLLHMITRFSVGGQLPLLISHRLLVHVCLLIQLDIYRINHLRTLI